MSPKQNGVAGYILRREPSPTCSESRLIPSSNGASGRLPNISRRLRQACSSSEEPGILRPLEGLPAPLRSYRVNKRFLVCEVARESIVVLTVIHGSIDLPNRLGELVLQLAADVAMLRDQLDSSRKK